MQSKKWHVLIVDDEFRIGTLIKKLIHWDELNLDCMAVVDNGGTAFEIIQSESCPNVVITDIRMPKINGLELIIMTKELQKDMKFIVISGYKEFEYAHQALKYGVEDYLLKPVSEDELNHVLKKISEELSASWQSEQEQRAFKETVSESRHIIKRDFLKNIIETEEPEVVDDRVEFQGEIYRGIDIKLDYVDYNKKDKKQDKLTTSRIEEIVERMGFTSAMYDASAKPFEDNVAETRSVVGYAHERGASVEAELGHILTSKAGAAEGNGKSYTREEAYTNPEMAKEFIERTNVDALAIGFGTAHGIYTEKPVLDLNRIALIKSAKDIPYVMHGGSGLSEEEYRTAIHNGIRKINYYTYLSLAGGRGVMQYLEDKKDKDAIYFEDIAKAGITAMKADVKRAMKIFESDGKI